MRIRGSALRRTAVGLIFALPVMAVSVAPARSGEEGAQAPAGELDCQVCHADFYESWQAGAHGQATVDPTFREALETQRVCDAVLESARLQSGTLPMTFQPFFAVIHFTILIIIFKFITSD